MLSQQLRPHWWTYFKEQCVRGWNVEFLCWAMGNSCICVWPTFMYALSPRGLWHLFSLVDICLIPAAFYFPVVKLCVLFIFSFGHLISVCFILAIKLLSHILLSYSTDKRFQDNYKGYSAFIVFSASFQALAGADLLHIRIQWRKQWPERQFSAGNCLHRCKSWKQKGSTLRRHHSKLLGNLYTPCDQKPLETCV